MRSRPRTEKTSFFQSQWKKIVQNNNTQRSGAQKRKTKKEKEAAVMEAVKEAVAEMERIKLGPTKIWTGLVLHHKDVFVSHVFRN